MFASPWIAGLVALFAWWFSTGLILVMVRRADTQDAHLWATLGNLPLLALGAFGFWASLDQSSIAAVYLAFFSALAIWGWIELSFLTGIITGPNKSHLKDGVAEWERFVRAWGTVAYHEIALVSALIAMLITAHGAPNQFAVWTFGLLFFARISAKLNLYLGVRKINVEFIPTPLRHLPSHFREANVNWLFPTSVTALSFATACWMERIADAQTPAAAVGFALLSALTALALLEHWLMVLKLPDEKLWRWMLPKSKDEDTGGPEHAL